MIVYSILPIGARYAGFKPLKGCRAREFSRSLSGALNRLYRSAENRFSLSEG